MSDPTDPILPFFAAGGRPQTVVPVLSDNLHTHQDETPYVTFKM